MEAAVPTISPWRRWAFLFGALLALAAFVGLANHSEPARLEEARRDLAAAGFGGAQIQRGQSHDALSRCGLGQLAGARAYVWTAGDVRGVLCVPADAPSRVLVDPRA